MKKSNPVENIVVGTFIVAVLCGVFLLERAKWNECRRYHPVWYCAMSGGK